MAKSKTNKSTAGIRIYLRHPFYLIKSGFFVLTWLVMGFHLELVGPTMAILAKNINVAYSGMGSILAARGGGYLIANISGAILQNIVKKYSEGLLVCAFVVPAIVVSLTPLVKSSMVLLILFFFQGTAQGLTDLGGTNILLTMWGENAAAPLNTAQLGYGIGAVLVNLLIRPFINQNSVSINITHQNGNEKEESFSNIITPYLITSGLCILIASGHGFFYFQARKNQRERVEVQQVDYTVVNTNSEYQDVSVKQTNASSYSPSTFGRGYFKYGLMLSIIFIIYSFFIGGNDQAFSKFFFSYLKFDKFNLSTNAASWGIILYWLSYSIGRLLCAIASLYVSANVCLSVIWIGGLCLAIAWIVSVWLIGLTTPILYSLGSATGLVFAPIFPLSLAFFNQRLNVVPILIALILCGSSFGSIVIQTVAGFILEEYPNHFPTIIIICILTSILLYTISNLIYHSHQRSYARNVPASTI